MASVTTTTTTSSSNSSSSGTQRHRLAPVSVSTMICAWIVISLIFVNLCHADEGNPATRRKREGKGGYDYGGNGDLSKVEVDMTGEDYEDLKKLRCHHCYLSVHGHDCITLEDFSKVEVQECLQNEPYCVVERLYTDNELTTFTRKCSQECQKGCISAGDNYRLESCSSCCQDDFCNTDNAAAPTVARRSAAAVVMVVVGAATATLLSTLLVLPLPLWRGS